jgi:hypothetical protein
MGGNAHPDGTITPDESTNTPEAPEVTAEQKQQEALAILDKPLALSVTEVILDDEGQPKDEVNKIIQIKLYDVMRFLFVGQAFVDRVDDEDLEKRLQADTGVSQVE